MHLIVIVCCILCCVCVVRGKFHASNGPPVLGVLTKEIPSSWCTNEGNSYSLRLSCPLLSFTHLFRYNPQFQLYVKENTDILINLGQPSCRPAIQSEDGEYTIGIGPVVCAPLAGTARGKRRFDIGGNEDRVGISLERDREACLRLHLEANEEPYEEEEI